MTPVIVETCHLLRKLHGGTAAALPLLATGAIEIRFSLTSEVTKVRQLIERHTSVPMSLADASLVRMAELDTRAQIVTLDSDFRIYRRGGRQALRLLLPE